MSKIIENPVLDEIIENEEETICDFHIFCIKIVQHLVSDSFYTNEKGKIVYDIKNLDNVDTMNYLKKLYDAVVVEKNKK